MVFRVGCLRRLCLDFSSNLELDHSGFSLVALLYVVTIWTGMIAKYFDAVRYSPFGGGALGQGSFCW